MIQYYFLILSLLAIFLLSLFAIFQCRRFLE